MQSKFMTMCGFMLKIKSQSFAEVYLKIYVKRKRKKRDLRQPLARQIITAIALSESWDSNHLTIMQWRSMLSASQTFHRDKIVILITSISIAKVMNATWFILSWTSRITPPSTYRANHTSRNNWEGYSTNKQELSYITALKPQNSEDSEMIKSLTYSILRVIRWSYQI